jgi:ankyrin repeat protein
VERPSHARVTASPSTEHLRKEAKRLARNRAIQLAHAQRLLASDYGFRDWATLVQYVESVESVRVDGPESLPALVLAVRARDLEAVRAALTAGGNPRRYFNGETPLHTAARFGSLAIVEALIEGGALEWQRDVGGRTTLELARSGRSPDRDAIVALLDRERIPDASFRAAVAALHAGDIATLAALLDAEPRLLTARIIGPGVYRKRKRADYFRDPKLFWYVANNPTTVARIAPNIVDVARTMIERGVDRADLDYALELVMSSGVARAQGHQLPLMNELLAAGAVASQSAILAAAAHWELEPLRALIDAGTPYDAPIAAALGQADELRRTLPDSNAEDVDLAFGLAAINRQHEAAQMSLAAGANIDAFLPIHSHATALHQAAANDDVDMIELLLRAGARSDILDTLWDLTPLDWALHERNEAAAAAFRRAR